MKRFFAIVSAAALAATTLATPANAQTSVDTVEAQYNKYGKCTNCVALTYDDGPAPGTARLLDILRERGVTASFFLVGKNALLHPWLVYRMRAEGHTVANHTFSHPRLPQESSHAIRWELMAANAAILSSIGGLPRWMGPPYTDYDSRVISSSRDLGLSIAAWDVDPQDWLIHDADAVCETTVEQAQPGSIVVMHDVHPSTVDAAPCILDGLAEKGLRPVSLDEMIPYPIAGAVYHTQ